MFAVGAGSKAAGIAPPLGCDVEIVFDGDAAPLAAGAADWLTERAGAPLAAGADALAARPADPVGKGDAGAFGADDADPDRGPGDLIVAALAAGDADLGSPGPDRAGDDTLAADGGKDDSIAADPAADGGELRNSRASGAVDMLSGFTPSAASFCTTDAINSLLPVSSFTNFTPMPVGPCSLASRRSQTTRATPRTLPPSPSASHSSFSSVPAAAGFPDRMNMPPADRSQQASWTNSNVVGLR
jgi:hypothetical protein